MFAKTLISKLFHPNIIQVDEFSFSPVRVRRLAGELVVKPTKIHLLKNRHEWIFDFPKSYQFKKNWAFVESTKVKQLPKAEFIPVNISDNLRISKAAFIPVVISENLRNNPTVSQNLSAPINIPNSTNCLCDPIITTIANKNLLEKLTVSKVELINDRTIIPTISISENLLLPFANLIVAGIVFASQKKVKTKPQGAMNADEFNEHVSQLLEKRKTSRRKPSRVVKSKSESVNGFDLSLLRPVLNRSVDLTNSKWLNLPYKLFPFQLEGVKRLVKSESFLLADEMGTGKTVMTCVSLRILIQKGLVCRALIVCPKSILSVWKQHFDDWAKSVSCVVVAGSVSDRSVKWNTPNHVYITTYDMLASDFSNSNIIVKNKNFDFVALDEAHAIKNPKTKRSRGILELHPKYRWGLTGTPIQNDAKELLALFKFIRPSLFAAWEIGSSVPTPEEARKRIKPYFLRRRKADVFPGMPPKIQFVKCMDLDPQQQEAYDLAINKFHNQHSEFTIIHVFTLLKELITICNFAPHNTSSPKADALIEQVSEVVSNGEKILVFTNRVKSGTDILEGLLERFGLVTINGKVSNTERQRRVEQFQNDPNTQVFLATLKTGGEGITLTEASYVVHFDHWWNPAVHWQAEDRAHRNGQTKTVNVYNYWMNGTIEERIRELQERKGFLHQEYVESLSQKKIRASYTHEDWCDVAGLDFRQMKK